MLAKVGLLSELLAGSVGEHGEVVRHKAGVRDKIVRLGFDARQHALQEAREQLFPERQAVGGEDGASGRQANVR